mmetsp:Transcript_66109/g.173310  ORF Transcript_66109/g.173310 Transcript_66109/m.173310 type:complete len:214 (+) Transcript_66109:564-1205(+)
MHPRQDRLQPLLLAGEDGFLHLAEVHPPRLLVALHAPQCPPDLVLRVAMGHCHLHQRVDDHLHRVARLGQEQVEERLPAVVPDHLGDLQVGVDVRPGRAAMQEAAVVRRPVAGEELQPPRGVGVLEVLREQEVQQRGHPDARRAVRQGAPRQERGRLRPQRARLGRVERDGDAEGILWPQRARRGRPALGGRGGHRYLRDLKRLGTASAEAAR